MKKNFNLEKCFVLGAAILVLVIMVVSACATTSKDEIYSKIWKFNDFEYADGLVSSDGTSGITIVKYHGKSTDVIIPSLIKGKPVVSISGSYYGNPGAFNKKGLTSVIIPDTVKFIGSNAFGDNNLTTLTLPERLQEIWSGAFYNNKLTEITFPENLKKIEGAAFRNNNLTNITLPENLQEIGGWAFENNKLSSVVLPNKLEMLGNGVFDKNPLKTPIIIPESVKRIYVGAGEWGVPVYANIRGTGASREITITDLYHIFKNQKRIVIPSNYYGIPVTNIASGTLSGPKKQIVGGYLQDYYTVDELVLPASLKTIQPDAFTFCDFKKVTAPNEEVKKIWDEYYLRQQVADKTGNKKAFNETLENLRALSEEFRPTR